MDTAVSVELFIEILNRYVYYFDQQNETVTTKYLNGLIELIHSNLQTSQNDGGSNSSLENPKRHFQRTLDYIKSREYEGVITEARL
jgi:vacuolar protein sorting-associated protein 35